MLSSADQSRETSCLLKMNRQSKLEECRLCTCKRSRELRVGENLAGKDT